MTLMMIILQCCEYSYGLLGPSGCGKTTLLRCIVGRLKIDDGHLITLRRPPGSVGHNVPGKLVGYMPQVFFYSFIQAISVAPLLVHYFSEALPTQHVYCAGVSCLGPQATASYGLAKGPYVAARTGSRDPSDEERRIYQWATTPSQVCEVEVLQCLSIYRMTGEYLYTLIMGCVVFPGTFSPIVIEASLPV